MASKKAADKVKAKEKKAAKKEGAGAGRKESEGEKEKDGVVIEDGVEVSKREEGEVRIGDGKAMKEVLDGVSQVTLPPS